MLMELNMVEEQKTWIDAYKPNKCFLVYSSHSKENMGSWPTCIKLSCQNELCTQPYPALGAG